MKGDLIGLILKGQDELSVDDFRRGEITVLLVKNFQKIVKLVKAIENRFMDFLTKRDFFSRRMGLTNLNVRSSEVVVLGSGKVWKVNFEDVEDTSFGPGKDKKNKDQYFQKASKKEFDGFYEEIHKSFDYNTDY